MSDYTTVTVRKTTKERLIDYKWESRSETWTEAMESLLADAGYSEGSA